ncbi:hypothetical protein SAMN02745216_02295 [Desulfatibacillum alkenivorans DSM 16219]|jgi:hypothetical protein|uniref:Pyridoxamine 5'-phosphate oxidase n=1 Tax=Desulfatibacillum alkenivorans DSM 16219 TaxID=1121393 RepID=A0A1M6MAD2_9BACT|nr:hypothetical protein [Desulfatibacillum alkenivorans]SHJ80402.1 hypothetical protein SAMN02745216_02295 [Desulfatibacillum alkenivorans DSM 16219]
MLVSETVAKFLESPDRTNVLATANAKGKVNAATFGSPMLVDGNKIRMMLGDNRTYDNLCQNPSAALFISMHGKTGMQMEGCRLYLKVLDMEDEGPEFDEVKSEIKKRIGDAAEMLKHLIKFEVTETRPIVDFGQGV